MEHEDVHSRLSCVGVCKKLYQHVIDFHGGEMVNIGSDLADGSVHMVASCVKLLADIS